MSEAVQRFHAASLGWCEVAADARAIDFTWNGSAISRPVFPNADPDVIAFERSISEVHKRTGIWRSALTKFVLTGGLDSSAFQRVVWQLSAHLPTDEIPELYTVGTLKIYVENLPREELRMAFAHLMRIWTQSPMSRQCSNRRAVLSEKLVKLISVVDAAGGPPPKRQTEFWTKVASRTKYPTWSAARQAY